MEFPKVPFFLFGMGGRRKVLYKQGTLLDLTTGEVIRQWDVWGSTGSPRPELVEGRSERIDPAAYAVHLKTTAGQRVSIRQLTDEEACWLETDGERKVLSRPCSAKPRPAKLRGLATQGEAEGYVNLPSFDGHRYAQVLRVLHQEMLVNIVHGAPLPNLIVYDKPWYRDAAMVCMCLQKTGNLHLVRDWILSLREPFDRNNAGTCEPDNPSADGPCTSSAWWPTPPTRWSRSSSRKSISSARGTTSSAARTQAGTRSTRPSG